MKKKIDFLQPLHNFGNLIMPFCYFMKIWFCSACFLWLAVQVLVQALVVFQYLTGEVKFKS